MNYKQSIIAHIDEKVNTKKKNAQLEYYSFLHYN